MTQLEIDRSVAAALGEPLREIRRRGFGLADPLDVDFHPEPCQRKPQVVDWDELDAQRVALFP